MNILGLNGLIGPLKAHLPHRCSFGSKELIGLKGLIGLKRAQKAHSAHCAHWAQSGSMKIVGAYCGLKELIGLQRVGSGFTFAQRTQMGSLG